MQFVDPFLLHKQNIKKKEMEFLQISNKNESTIIFHKFNLSFRFINV